MPHIYIDPEISKKLMELSGGDRHPIVDRFCREVGHGIVHEEMIENLRMGCFVTLIIANIVIWSWCGSLFL